MGTYQSKYTGEEIDNKLGQVGAASRAYFNYDKVEEPVTNASLALTNTSLNGIELDNKGNPILKAGKSYRIMFNVYTCNLPDGASNRFFASMTNGTDTKTNLAVIYPVTASKSSSAQNVTNYIGVVNPTTDFALEVWAVHGSNGSTTTGCSALRFNLLIDEVI